MNFSISKKARAVSNKFWSKIPVYEVGRDYFFDNDGHMLPDLNIMYLPDHNPEFLLVVKHDWERDVYVCVENNKFGILAMAVFKLFDWVSLKRMNCYVWLHKHGMLYHSVGEAVNFTNIKPIAYITGLSFQYNYKVTIPWRIRRWFYGRKAVE